MPSVADIKPVEAVQLLILGKSKLGKTEGAGTWPRPIFLDFDNGMRTLRSPEFKLRHPEVDISSIRYETFTERDIGPNGVIRRALALDDACEFFDACMKPGTVEWTSKRDGSKMLVGRDTFSTFVIDSITSLATVAMNKAIVLTGDPNFISKRNLTETFKLAQNKGMISPEGSDYAASQSLVEQFIDMVRGSNKNVIFLGHEQTVTNKEGGVTGYELMITGKSVEKIPLRFDEVYFLKLEAAKMGADNKPYYPRILQTHADGLRKAGTRIGVPDGIAWDYKAISSIINPVTSKEG